MPITIGTLTSHVTITDSAGARANPAEFEQLVKLIAMRLKEIKSLGDDDDSEISDRRTDKRD